MELNDKLLDIVCEKIEQVSELPEMLKDIGYLDNKETLIEQTTACEILDISNSVITDQRVSENKVQIDCEIDFILQTFIDHKIVWRVQAAAKVRLSAPLAASEYENYDPGFVDVQSLEYIDVECDDLLA